MINMKIIGTKARYISTAQGNHIRDPINYFDQPGDGTGRDSEKRQCSVRSEARDKAQDPQRSGKDKNHLFQRIRTILTATKGRNAINGYILSLFSARQVSKPGGYDRNDVSQLFKLIGDMRAGVPRTTTNRRILTVNDKDMHTRT